jgi:hypothetical protein
MAYPSGRLHRVAFNLANSHYRRRRAERRALVRYGWDAEGEDHTAGLAHGLAVRRAIRDLSAPQRQAVALFYFAELPIVEIADAMGIGENTVKSHRGRPGGALTGLAELPRPGGVAIVNEPVGPVLPAATAWDVLPPGDFSYDQIGAQTNGWETVVELGESGSAVFDVAGDGTVAAFVTTTGTLMVQAAAGRRLDVDASSLTGAVHPDSALHQLRVGPDGRIYLTWLEPNAAGDRHRLAVFDRGGALVGTKDTPVSHEPVFFEAGRVWIRTDERWAAVATIAGDLRVEVGQDRRAGRAGGDLDRRPRLDL